MAKPDNYKVLDRFCGLCKYYVWDEDVSLCMGHCAYHDFETIDNAICDDFLIFSR